MIRKNSKKAKFSESAEKAFISSVRTALFECDNSEYRVIVDRIMDETGETAAEIAAALVGMAFKASAPEKKQQAAPAKKGAEKKTAKPASQKKAPQAKSKPAPAKTVRLSINGGLNKHFTHKDIIGALSARAGIKTADLKGIQISERQTHLQVSSGHAAKIISAMNTPDGKIKGVPVKVQISKDRKKK